MLMSSTIFLLMTLLGFTSCSVNDNAVIDNDPQTSLKNITADVYGGFYEIELTGISSNQEWNATSDADWLAIVNAKGKGNATVKVFIEANFEGVSRNATINIQKGNNYEEIGVFQEYPMTANGSGIMETNFNKGLGHGYDITQMKKLSTAVINKKAIEFLKEHDMSGNSDDLYQEDSIESPTLVEARHDSIENKKDTLGIHAELQIQYSLFKFSASADFDMHEKRLSNSKEIGRTVHWTKLNSAIDLVTLAGMYHDYKDGDTRFLRYMDDGEEYRDLIFNLKFAKAVDEIEALCEQDKDATSKIKQFVENYGQAIATETELGGVYDMHFTYDSVAVEEKLGVEHAKVALSITQGLFKLDAGVEVTYEKEAETLAENSYITCFVKGGIGSDVSSLISAFKQYAISPLNQEKYDALDEARERWCNGIKVSEERNTAELIGVGLTPIWQVFKSDKASNAVMKYIFDKYGNNETAKVFLNHYK